MIPNNDKPHRVGCHCCSPTWRTIDATPTPKQEPFRKGVMIERQYKRQLASVAHTIGKLIGGVPDPLENPSVVEQINRMMARYAEVLEPWAQAVGSRMVAEVNRANEQAWNHASRTMSRALREEIAHAPTGLILREKRADQVRLITSLPTDAAERVQKLVLDGLADSTRADEIADRIQASGQVSRSRAMLIARTEVATTASVLTQARSEWVGSTHYHWRTAKDEAVRASHRKMEGVVCEWAKPPTLSDGTTTHAGQIYNCRCYPEPIF